ncbi:hypothetical protein CROQUDRAFT_59184 [Cronartium quercuum f. sp. fusiforme G11]|uniref:DUF7872 domain-containing protein n=1 Tax=Cronartium quercuum f. sp. fusiforme G11 TaxID=708437 RepID=A0A9P6NQ59_9BASI|nr:hypothetical protein CROQUDRAFT_59184 [Cronartium quercuum f. sp. fusiforme G11]
MSLTSFILLLYFLVLARLTVQLVMPLEPMTCPNEIPISAKEWKNQNIDHYLSNYPGGQNISFAQFTSSIGVLNFQCGIGQQCLAGQFCNSGLKAIDWQILFAVQQWTMWINSMYQAAGFAVMMVQGALSSLIADLIDFREINHFFKKAHSLLIKDLAFFSAVFVGACFLFRPASMILLVVTIAVLDHAAKKAERGVSRHHRSNWNDVLYYLPIWERQLHSALTNYTDSTLMAPISTEQGIYGAIRGGDFLDLGWRSKHTVSDLQEGLRMVILTRGVVLILRSMNAFITRGSNPCKDRGPNGAWRKVGRLSYCGDDRVMMNIIIADGDKSLNKIHNGQLIATKYGLTTEFLTVSSWKCQQTYNQTYAYDPYNTQKPFPTDPNADCVANLPVCDCTTKEFKKSIKSGKTTVEACRSLGLPI